MATKQECDQYAAELTQRFEDLVKWATDNWPQRDFPLLRSDFSASRREISQIVGPKLGDGESDDLPSSKRTRQFIPTNPMPWP